MTKRSKADGTEWCECIDASNFKAVYVIDPFTNERVDIWVHAACSKPSIAKWEAGIRYCLECGATFSAPLSAETCCLGCYNGPYSGHPCQGEADRTYISWEVIRNTHLPF